MVKFLSIQIMPVDFILKDYDILNSQLSTMLKASFPIKLLFTLCSYEKKTRKLSCAEIGPNSIHRVKWGKKNRYKTIYATIFVQKGKKQESYTQTHHTYFYLYMHSVISGKIHHLVVMAASREVNLVAWGQKQKKNFT